MSIDHSRSFAPRETKTPEADPVNPSDALQQKLDEVKLDGNIRLPQLPGGQGRGGWGAENPKEFLDKFLREHLLDPPSISPIERTNEAIEDFKKQKLKPQGKPQLGGQEDLRLASTRLGNSADGD